MKKIFSFIIFIACLLVIPFATIQIFTNKTKNVGNDNLVSINHVLSGPIEFDSSVLLGWQLPSGSKIKFDNWDTTTTPVGYGYCDIIGSTLTVPCDIKILSFTADNTIWEVRNINSGGFNTSNLKTIELNTKLLKIKNGAFYNCTSLTAVLFPIIAEIQQIGEDTTTGNGAFENCTSLITNDTNFNYSNTITIFGYRAFAGCSMTNNFRIKNGIRKLCPYLFYNCVNLTSITITTTNRYITTLSDSIFEGCANLRNFDSQKLLNLNNIGNKAFYGCTKLDNVYINNDTLTTIGNSAFENCTNLVNANILNAKNITSIGNRAFANSAITALNIQGINNNCTIGSEAYTNTKLSNILIDPKITNIGDKAFSNIQTLITVTFTNDWNNQLWNTSYDLFQTHPNLTKIYVPYSNVQTYKTSIPSYTTYFDSIKIDSIEILGTSVVRDTIYDPTIGVQYTANVNIGANPNNISWSIALDETPNQSASIDSTGLLTWSPSTGNGSYHIKILCESNEPNSTVTKVFSLIIEITKQVPTSLITIVQEPLVIIKSKATNPASKPLKTLTNFNDEIKDVTYVLQNPDSLPKGLIFNRSNGIISGFVTLVHEETIILTVETICTKYSSATTNNVDIEINIKAPDKISPRPINYTYLFSVVGLIALFIILLIILSFFLV